MARRSKSRGLSAGLMKPKSLLLVIILIVSSQQMFFTSEITTNSALDEKQPMAQSVASQWQINDAPPIQSGWSANTWQPDPKGPLWDLDFSPDATKIAGVEISDNRLFVWNISDGRVLLWIHHSAAIVDVVWLSNEWVLVADSGTNWYSYHVVDNGSSTPHTSTEMRSGQWTDGLTGTYSGYLWGLDASLNHSKVAFCGNINHMNMGGEIVIADISHFIDGSPANAQHFFPQYWSVDCAISPNGAMVAAIGRNLTTYSDGNVTYRDVVYGVDVATGALQWERFVGGDNSSAWAVTWEPGGGSYTIAYNHPLPSQPNVWEGVATAYAEVDGSVFWYSPIPQNVSSLRWLPDGSYLGVGLYDPGRISFIDTAGHIQTDFGWHAVKSGSTSIPEDITAVATASISAPTTANQLMASAGRDGAIEIWTIDVTTFEILPYRRLGPAHVREIAVHPILDLVAIADSSGVVTVRASNGSIDRQCFHPEYGMVVYEIPFAKSVDWINDEAIVAFSDGVIIACNEFSKWSWSFDLRDHKTVGAFGRIAMHQTSNYAAISWSSNTLNTSLDGHVAIIEPMSGQFFNEWQYSDSHWTMAFNDFGTKLASVSQTGDVRLWNTSDPNPQNWMDDGSPYSHNGYAGVTEWMPGADLLVTAGWDKQLIMWDVQSQSQMQQITLSEEPFAFAELLNDGVIVIATGNAQNSLTGQLEFYDIQNNSLVNTYQMNHIPRGLGVFPSDQSLVVVNHTGTMLVLKQDADGDGWIDVDDAFPNDPTQHEDSDGDGWGDDQTQSNGDHCLNTQGNSYQDRNGCPDSDGDGYSDADATWLAHPLGAADAFPNMPSQWHDTDGDSHGDEYSFTVGNDGLRVGESGDAFITDASQYRDLDGDGCGDNYTYGDDNGLRINEAGDAFISDPTQCNDFDGDGYGDNYTFTIDNAGLRVEAGDAFPMDYMAWSDLDGDGCPTSSATGLAIDLYPTDSENCDEDLPFWLPINLAILISNDASLWYLDISWDSAADNTDIIRLEYALNNETLSPIDSDFSAIQVWTSTGAVNENLSINPEAGNNFLHLRLTGVPDDGDSISRNWTSVWIVYSSDENTTENGSENTTNNLDSDGDGVIDSADNCPNEQGLISNQGCPTTTTTNDTSNQTGNDEINPEDESTDTPVIWYVLIAVMLAGIAVLAVMGIRYNRKTEKIVEGVHSMAQPSSFAPPSTPPSPTMHLPCKKCGGFVQEVMHQENLWTWCPSCREWQDFLGKR